MTVWDRPGLAQALYIPFLSISISAEFPNATTQPSVPLPGSVVMYGITAATLPVLFLAKPGSWIIGKSPLALGNIKIIFKKYSFWCEISSARKVVTQLDACPTAWKSVWWKPWDCVVSHDKRKPCFSIKFHYLPCKKCHLYSSYFMLALCGVNWLDW